MIDFLIIGGGVAGASAAFRLSSLGSTVVLEREDALAYHASGRSAALFEPNYGKPAVVALNKASAGYLSETDGGVLSPRGLMIIGTADTKEQFTKDVAEFEMHKISVDEACAIVPILDKAIVTNAAMDSIARDIDTDLLIQNFARKARANGAKILTKTGVKEIRKTPSGWAVTAGNDVFEARHIINAAGAWADEIATMAGIAPIGLTPLRRSMARIPAPGGHDVSSWPMIFGPGETWYAKPDAGALLVSPADETAVEPHDAFADDMTLAEGLDRYEGHVTEPVTRLLSSWAGLRTFAPDRQLVIGPSASDPSFVWSAGQGGYGMQTSPAASQLLADLISGNTPKISKEAVVGTAAHRFG